MFIEEMLTLAPFAKIFAIGPKQPLQKTLFLLHALPEDDFNEILMALTIEKTLATRL